MTKDAIDEDNALSYLIDGDVEAFAKLLAKGGKKFLAARPLDKTWLYHAADFGQLEIVKLLVKKGVDLDERDPTFNLTALAAAASEGNLDVVQFLIESGASLDMTLPDNPILSAVYGGYEDIVRLLVDSGADVHKLYDENEDPYNCLSFALANGQSDIAAFLRERGCQLPPDRASTTSNPSHTLIRKAISMAFGEVLNQGMHELLPVSGDNKIAVNIVPSSDESPITLFTTGVSDEALKVKKGGKGVQHIELIMHLPSTWPLMPGGKLTKSNGWPAKWLQNVGGFLHNEGISLDGPFLIVTPEEPPRPLGPNTKMTCLLLMAVPDAWGTIKIDKKKTVRFFNVSPLYTEERDFESEAGLAKLLSRFQENGITTVLDVKRKNVASMP